MQDMASTSLQHQINTACILVDAHQGFRNSPLPLHGAGSPDAAGPLWAPRPVSRRVVPLVLPVPVMRLVPVLSLVGALPVAILVPVLVSAAVPVSIPVLVPVPVLFLPVMLLTLVPALLLVAGCILGFQLLLKVCIPAQVNLSGPLSCQLLKEPPQDAVSEQQQQHVLW